MDFAIYVNLFRFLKNLYDISHTEYPVLRETKVAVVIDIGNISTDISPQSLITLQNIGL